MESPRPSLVRRFTAELKADSNLASQVKSYQENLDAEAQEQGKLHMDIIYHGQLPTESPLDGLEIARQTLQSKCDEFFRHQEEKAEADRKRSGVTRFFYGNATGQKLAKYIGRRGQLTVDQVPSITNELEAQWVESNSKAATNFVKICKVLDSHKQIFEIFPSETAYTSALCGAVSMIIQASVTYSDIAEQLSRYVKELSEKIALCTKWLDLFKTPEMQARLSDIYTQYFDFFIKVATWYLKPKASKILDSFNSNFATRYKSASESIKESIQMIDDQARFETVRETKQMRPHFDRAIAHLEQLSLATLDSVRKGLRGKEDDYEAARTMCTLLEQMDERNRQLEERSIQMQERMSKEIDRIHLLYQRQTRETIAIGNTPMNEREISEIEDVPQKFDRAEAELVCRSLLPSLIDQVGGSDGIRLAIQTGRLAAKPAIIQILGNWTQATSHDALNLWIMSPHEHGVQSSAQLAALGVIWTAIQARAQFVSYICQRPQYGNISGFQDVEDQASALGMVYSLICQLLQFQPPNDRVQLLPEMVDGLTQPGKRWTTGLKMLQYLLENTSTLRYCIIHGINLLEGDAQDMCQEFVDLLFAHSRNAEWPLRILLTTSGQSRVLTDSVSLENKVISHNTFRRTKVSLVSQYVQMAE
ncbi:hypothetical protein N7507_000920 [Penicillium longicatenatum]|nr:hypothetical protein N7507_000920 [Penicillium longicatenatum]